MATANEVLLDRAIRHALYLQRFKAGEVAEILKFLDGSVFPDITRTLKERFARKIAKGFDPGPWTTDWIIDVRRSVGVMTQAGAKVAGGTFEKTMQSFAVSEADFQKSLLKAAVPFDVDFRSPAPELLRSIVSQKPIEGIPFGGWWKKLGDDTRDDIVGAVKTGLAQGEKPEKIIRRLTGTAKHGFRDGVYQTARHRAEAMVRTIAAKIQVEATFASFLANADTVKGWQFVATLDTRTTTICMGHDGKVYPLTERRSLPPLHWQCRSTIVAVLKSWEEIGLDDLGLKEPPDAATRASMGGEVAQKLLYPDWLRGQSLAIQNDALGPGKADVFRRGLLPLDRFYDDGNRPLALPELWALEKEAEAQSAKIKKILYLAKYADAQAAEASLLARQKDYWEQYAKEKSHAARAVQAQQDLAAYEFEQAVLAEEKALSQAAAVEQAQAEAAAAAAAQEAAKADAEIAAAKEALDQAEHDADVKAANAGFYGDEKAAAAALAEQAQDVAAAAHGAQEAAEELGQAAADAVVVPPLTANPIEFGKAAKQAVADVVADLKKQLKEAGVEIAGLADAEKKALKKAYDSAWKQASDLAKKGKTADLAAVTKGAAEKAAAGIKEAAAAALADSVAAAEKAAASAVADAVAAASKVEGAKAAGQAAAAQVEAAYAKLLAKKAGKISSAEQAALAAEAKVAKKKAYDKAWNVAKQAEKKAGKAAATAGAPAPKPVPAQAAQAAQAEKVVAKAQAQAPPASAKEAALKVDPIVDADQWTNYGPQKGSNPGGFYTDPDGVKWYVKTPKTDDHAYNEILAGRLYALTGTKSAQTKLVRLNGKLSVASRIEELDDAMNRKGVVAFAKEWKQAGKLSPAGEGFAADAWLANWDAVGMSGDNLLFGADGKLIRIDSGGALRYRAQGGAKGSAFGDTVGEIDTLRGAGQGAGTKAAEVFQHLTDQEIVASIDRVLGVKKSDIYETVLRWGPRSQVEAEKLFATLSARYDDLQARRDYFYKRSLGIKAPPVARKLAEKWGIRVELKREAIKKVGLAEIETMPETGPVLVAKEIGDTDRDPKYVAQWNKWVKTLTPEQRTAIHDWSGSGYSRMRAAQVGAEKATGAKLSASDATNLDVLRIEAGLHHAPRYRGTIHRGMKWSVDEYHYPNFDENDVFELEAISSFSTNEGVAQAFSMGRRDQVPVLFHVENSYSGVQIKSLSAISGEAEVLALRRAKYRVLRIKRHPDSLAANGVVQRYGRLEIWLEEISGK